MIDWGRVAAVRHEVGEAEFRPIIELFLDEIEGAIMGIAPQDAAGGVAGDAASLRHALQFMKGCALNIGLTALCQTCDAWEAMLLQGRQASLQVDSLMESYAASRQALMRDIEARTAHQDTGAA